MLRNSDRNLARNTDNHQRIIMNIDEREAPLEGAGWIAKTTSEQGSSYSTFQANKLPIGIRFYP